VIFVKKNLEIITTRSELPPATEVAGFRAVNSMKKHLSSGLAILLPILFTCIIISILVDFLTAPFLESTRAFLDRFSFFHNLFPFLQTKTVTILLSKALILILLSGFILLIGLCGKLFLIDTLFRLGDHLLRKLPLINKIYKASQDIVQSLFSSSSNKFSQVVLAPFPDANNLTVGFITAEAMILQKGKQGKEEVVSVFIPGTPNPSVGFMLLFKKKQLLLLNIKVDEAMKWVISCGVMTPDFEIIHPKEPDVCLPFNQSDILSSERERSQNSVDL